MEAKANRILWMDESSHLSARKRSRSKPRIFVHVALFMLFLMTGSLFYVWSRIQVIQLGYDISHGLKEGKRLVESNKKLRLEITALTSDARIEKVAVEELKMSKPKSHQVVVIR